MRPKLSRKLPRSMSEKRFTVNGRWMYSRTVVPPHDARSGSAMGSAGHAVEAERVRAQRGAGRIEHHEDRGRRVVGDQFEEGRIAHRVAGRAFGARRASSSSASSTSVSGSKVTDTLQNTPPPMALGIGAGAGPAAAAAWSRATMPGPATAPPPSVVMARL